MSLDSINTNMAAMVALQSLNDTSSALQATEKQISTGYRVADATDDGAAYAVAQRVRSDVGALTSANQQLGGVQGLLSTTLSALTNVSNTMNSVRDVLVKLADSTVTGTERTQYAQQLTSLTSNIQSFFEDATYNGKTLVGNIGGTSGFGAVSTIRNEVGSTYGIATYGGSTLLHTICLSGATSFTLSANALSAISATGTFTAQLDAIGSALNTYGSDTTWVNNQITYNSDKIDALNSGLGSLIDANLAQESAQLQALQIRQQLGTQALSLANQAPQSLLSLFK